MKQHITPKQAKEVTGKQFYSLFEELVRRGDWSDFHHKKMTIGKMIEALNNNSITDIGIRLNSDRNNIGVWVGDKKNKYI